ncbi:pPIWI_RE module domain-containing protein [Streptomyces liangshanensis]|uniref:RNAseH domain-containing protein n=1 Tax=Streptomyces liangshanensis TaxID=2717324 RepID=A0A6G9H4A3_9ACTN|nr:DUF3962 domain-containing protein [Streptomyces liangshanensis]QIQ05119.1 RNAseH domain-containing protein [Streptomyces liangshanensis]
MYHTVRCLAYEPDPDRGPWMEHLQVLRLGEDLHNELTRRSEEANATGDRPGRLPVTRLNSLLQALAPGTVATARHAGSDGRLPWLYAREAVPVDVLAPVIGTWASGLLVGGEGDDDDDLEETLLTEGSASGPRLPAWENTTIDLTETLISGGGTAEPEQRLYSLLPEQIAFRLAEHPLRIRGTILRFRVVSSASGTDLISWPPQRYERGRQTWYYSARLNITVHTVPFAPRFRVHISAGLRRWATRLDIRPRELDGSTVLLDVPIPWPDSADHRRRLMTNTLGYDRRKREIAWRRRSAAPLLPELDILRHYPDAAELFASPEKWITGRGEVAAGIVYHPSLGPHEVGAGLMPGERATLDAWIEDGLRPVLRRVDDLRRVTRRNTPTLLPRTVKKDEPDTREARKSLARRTALAVALSGQSLDVEVVWQSPETRDALLAELPRLIGLPPGSNTDREKKVWRWRHEGIDITVRTRPAGPLVAALTVAQDRGRRRSVRLAEAVEERCALVLSEVGPPWEGIGLVIAEIADKGRFSAVPDSDPKNALRLAWARQGRPSQFINLPQEDTAAVEHRARSTWLDAFRQLGAVSPPAHRVGAGIPSDLQYVALWMVRYTRKGPTRCPVRRLIAVRVRPGGGGLGDVDGWDAERAEWVPYRQLLLQLADSAKPEESSAPGNRLRQPAGSASDSARAAGRSARWQAQTERQIRELLFQLRERPTLLLVSAGNLRQHWPYLRNGALVRDCLAFGTEPQQRHSLYGEELRVVVLRDANGRNEVAEWYAHDGKGKVGFAEGVWGTSDLEGRVFSSITSTPHTAANLPRGLMKLVPAEGSRTAPGKTAWNPTQLEVTVLGCRSPHSEECGNGSCESVDNAAEWATLTHQLRYHDDYQPLSRPLPLHLARLAGEYVLPLATGGEPAKAGDGLVRTAMEELETT